MVKTPDKPPFSVIPGETTRISPPRPLGTHGTRLWDAVMAEYRIEDRGGIEILAQCCASLDRAESLAEAIARDGDVVRSRTGVPKSHPAIRDELAARAFVPDPGEAWAKYRNHQTPGPSTTVIWLDAASLMPGTRRTPIVRHPGPRITPEAVQLFAEGRRLQKRPRTEKNHYVLLDISCQLDHTLGLQPWNDCPLLDCGGHAPPKWMTHEPEIADWWRSKQVRRELEQALEAKRET